MIEHWCQGVWRPGVAANCPRHAKPGRAPNLTPFAERTNTVTEGVASTGQVSPKGTVSHTEHWSGRVDGLASPAPVTVRRER